MQRWGLPEQVDVATYPEVKLARGNAEPPRKIRPLAVHRGPADSHRSGYFFRRRVRGYVFGEFEQPWREIRGYIGNRAANCQHAYWREIPHRMDDQPPSADEIRGYLLDDNILAASNRTHKRGLQLDPFRLIGNQRTVPRRLSHNVGSRQRRCDVACIDEPETVVVEHNRLLCREHKGLQKTPMEHQPIKDNRYWMNSTN